MKRTLRRRQVRTRRVRKGGDDNEVNVNYSTGSNEGASDIQDVRRSLRRTNTKLYGARKTRRHHKRS
jgi:hypothetical protein